MAYGIEQWLDSYQSPVASKEFQHIYDTLNKEFVRLITQKEKSNLYWTGICNYKLILFLAHKCFFQLRFNRLREQGYQSIYDSTMIPVDDAIQALSNDFYAAEADMDFGLKNIDFCRYHWRKVRTNWGAVSPFNALFPKYASCKNYVLGGRNVKELKTYSEAMNDIPVTLQPRTFYPSARQFASPADQQDVGNFISSLLNFLKQTFPEASSFVNDRFAELTNTYFLNTLNAIEQCRLNVKNWTPKPVLVTGIGNVHHRIFSVAWKSIKGKTVNFTHGNSYCLAYKPGSITTGSHALVDDYVASSNGEAQLLEDAKKDFNNGLETFDNIVVNPTNVYRPIADSFKQMAPVKSVKKVMLLGYPMSYHYHLYHPEQHSLAHVHLEINLLKILKKHGFTTIYKAHPDTLNEIKGLYNQYVDEIVPEPFEQVCKAGLADCVLFGSSSTTTFGYVLLTKMPVVVLDTKGTHLHNDVRPLLEKRCAFVNADTDQSGHFTFNEAELVDAVKQSVDRLDMEIVQRFALS